MLNSVVLRMRSRKQAKKKAHVLLVALPQTSLLLESHKETTSVLLTIIIMQTLYLTPLLALKKFRKKGNKDGAIRAFYRLEEEGLGRIGRLKRHFDCKLM